MRKLLCGTGAGSLIFVLLICCSAGAGERSIELVNDIDGGRLYKTESGNSTVDIVVLEGSYYQMGLQYGKLLKNKMDDFYQEGIRDIFIGEKAFTDGDLKEYVITPFWKSFSARQREMIRGISDGSGLSTDKVVLIDQFVTILMLQRRLNEGAGSAACTSMAVWGDLTKDGSIYTIRDFDFPISCRGLAGKYATVLVLKPNDGSCAVAGLCLTGMLSFTDAMNEKGIYYEWNNGAGTQGLTLFDDRAPIGDELVNFLLDSDTQDTFVVRARTTRANYPTIVLLAGPEEAFYIENATFDMKIRSAGAECKIAAANQYLDPSWGIPPLPSPSMWYSEKRRTNFERLAAGRKDKIDEYSLMEILDEPLFNKDGSFGKGAAVLEYVPKGSMDVTVWQVISKPAERKMWVRIPTRTDWILIDLNVFFGE